MEHYLTETGSDGFRLKEGQVKKWVPHGATEATLAGTVGVETMITAEVNLRQQRALTLLAAELVRSWNDRLVDEGDGRRARRRLLFHDAMKIVKRWCELAEVWDVHYDGLGSSALDQAVEEIDAACIPTGGTADRLVAAFSYPMLLDTSGIRFETSLEDRYDATNSELNIAACHSNFEAGLREGARQASRRDRMGKELPSRVDGALLVGRDMAPIRTRLRGSAVRRARG